MMHIITHFSFQFVFLISRSSEEDERHKEGEQEEGGQEARAEGVEAVDEKW